MKIEEPTRAGHTRVPDELAKRTDLNWEQKMILAYIGRMQEYQSGGASCTLTYPMIGEALGLTWRRVMDLINGVVYKDKRTKEPRLTPGIPEADLTVTRYERSSGSSKYPPNHYSATWAAQRALRRKHAKQAEVIQLKSPTESGGDVTYGIRENDLRAHVGIRNIGE